MAWPVIGHCARRSRGQHAVAAKLLLPGPLSPSAGHGGQGPAHCQCRYASKKKPENLKKIEAKRNQARTESALPAKPTMSDLMSEFGRDKVQPWDAWKYKAMVAPQDKAAKKSQKKEWLSFEKKGLVLPEKAELGKSMLFRKGLTQDERDELDMKKKLATVEHITDPAVRQIFLEELEEREARLDRLDPHGYYEKLEQLRALGQPDVEAKDGTRVLVLQPRIKHTLQRLRGTGEQRRNLSEWDLREAVSLVDGMGTHYAAGRYIISVPQVNSKSFFGDQALEEIACIMDIDCFEEVMVNESQLGARQRGFLENLWGCRVYDRYNTVLHIFRNRAVTPDAKLQIRLAELMNERCMMKQTVDRNQLHESELLPGYFDASTHDTDLIKQKRKDHMDNMIKKVKEKLEKSKIHRENRRENRRIKEVPLVALVGYTNAGKTSLVGALSAGSKVEGDSKVFATLDSTVHRCRLPSGLNVVISDTVGFISDLPPDLMATFESTLADSLEADVVLHVRDASHPNTEGQRANVLRVLLDIGFSDERIEDMVDVCNKIDLSSELVDWQQSLLPKQYTHDLPATTTSVDVSATTGIGIDELKRIIDAKMSTKRHLTTLTIPSSGKELSWLHKHAGVSKCEVTEDGSELIVDIIISAGRLQKFSFDFPAVQISPDLMPPEESFDDEVEEEDLDGSKP